MVRVSFLLLCIFYCGIAQAASVRRSIFSLDPNGQEIASLRHGIQVMQSRPSTDPTSWTYQANMHGTYDQPVLTAWNGCQHGSFFFFSWHRMYLYYFERILRAASGDPNLALPYWNYTDDPNLPDPDRRQLPLAFRQPADSSNPLFVSQRRPDLNNGTGFLDPGIVDYSRAFTFTNFDAPVGSGSASFGGPTRSNHPTSNDDFGALESTPHNDVHNDFGGWMRDPNLSARDPIFYLHHANIDRLWKRWLAQGGGRQDPTSDQVWMNTMFTFFDENGQQVQKSGKDVLDTVSQLNYCYDDEAGCIPPPPPPPETIADLPKNCIPNVRCGSVVELLCQRNKVLPLDVEVLPNLGFVMVAEAGPPNVLTFRDALSGDTGTYHLCFRDNHLLCGDIFSVSFLPNGHSSCGPTGTGGDGDGNPGGPHNCVPHCPE